MWKTEKEKWNDLCLWEKRVNDYLKTVRQKVERIKEVDASEVPWNIWIIIERL